MNLLQRRAILLRTYGPGDEAILPALWEAVHGSYAGTVPRDPAYWRWCILGRPGVDPSRILVTEVAGTVRGYAVLDHDGSVLELAVDRDLSRPIRRRLVDRLVAALEDRARRDGAQLLRFRVPRPDREVNAVLRRRGYLPSAVRSLQWVIVDLMGLCRAVLTHHRERLTKAGPVHVILDVDSGGYHFAPVRRLAVRAGDTIEVGPDPGEESVDATFHTDLPTIVDVVFGRETIDRAIRAGRIRVDPSDRRALAIRFFQALRIERPWFTPLADHR